jgi:hypothetical protein
LSLLSPDSGDWKMDLMEKYKTRLNPEPPEDVSEGRLKTLADVMEATLLYYRDQIIRGGRWRPSEATREAGKRIDEMYRAVMAGTGKLLAFRAACEEWQRIGETNNETFNT